MHNLLESRGLPYEEFSRDKGLEGSIEFLQSFAGFKGFTILSGFRFWGLHMVYLIHPSWAPPFGHPIKSKMGGE